MLPVDLASVSGMIEDRLMVVEAALHGCGAAISDARHVLISDMEGRVTAILDRLVFQGVALAWGRLTGVGEEPGVCVLLYLGSVSFPFNGPFAQISWAPKRNRWELEFGSGDGVGLDDEPTDALRRFLVELEDSGSPTSRVRDEEAAKELLRRVAGFFLARRRSVFLSAKGIAAAS